MANEGEPITGADPGADDDGLVVESLSGVDGGAGPRRSVGRRVDGEAAQALWGRRLSGRQRVARGALIVTLVAATLFALLGGPALTVAGWQRLTFALRSGTLAPRLAITSWRTTPQPKGFAPGSLTYTADPVAQFIIFACHADASGVTFLRTEDGGNSWQRVQVTSAPAQTCQVKVALDSSLRLLLLARSPDSQRPGCQRLSLYHSVINGYSWSAVALPTDAVGAACLADAWQSASWIFAWWATATEPAPVTRLMRSDDLGATWQSADGGLPERDAYLAPALTRYGAGDALLALVYYWPRHGRLNVLRQVVHSLDDGTTWETLSGGPLGLSLLASPEPRVASVGAWSILYSPVYTDEQLSPLWTPDQPPEGIQALTTRTGVWRELPPLPVDGTATVDHLMGVATTLGVAPTNVLLTLGADPHNAVSAHPDPRDVWLWAWDPVANGWRLGQQAPSNAHLVGFSWDAGPVGSPYAQTYGAYLWLTGERGAGQALYSAFIPVPSGN